jgi:hypothetical protein
VVHLEAIYDDMNSSVGFAGFGPVQLAEDALLSARQALRKQEKA